MDINYKDYTTKDFSKLSEHLTRTIKVIYKISEVVDVFGKCPINEFDTKKIEYKYCATTPNIDNLSNTPIAIEFAQLEGGSTSIYALSGFGRFEITNCTLEDSEIGSIYNRMNSKLSLEYYKHSNLEKENLEQVAFYIVTSVDNFPYLDRSDLSLFQRTSGSNKAKFGNDDSIYNNMDKELWNSFFDTYVMDDTATIYTKHNYDGFKARKSDCEDTELGHKITPEEEDTPLSYGTASAPPTYWDWFMIAGGTAFTMLLALLLRKKKKGSDGRSNNPDFGGGSDDSDDDDPYDPDEYDSESEAEYDKDINQADEATEEGDGFAYGNTRSGLPFRTFKETIECPIKLHTGECLDLSLEYSMVGHPSILHAALEIISF